MMFLQIFVSLFVISPRDAQPPKRRAVAWTKVGWGTYIGVLCVDSSDQICEAMFFFILVRNKEGISVEVAMVDLEASLVGNPNAISEGGGARMMIAGHIMEYPGRK